MPHDTSASCDELTAPWHFLLSSKIHQFMVSMMAFLSKTRPSDKSRGWLLSGWRKAAIVNIGLLSTALLVLIGVFAVAVSKTNGNFRQSWTFYTTVCRDRSTSQIDTILHLLINILSTIVLASSNFFMQVLNAPSRQEVDSAHARGIWLDIGVPSWRNAFYLTKFKLAAWISLLLTSIPIHMLFNSSVFQITSRMGDFHLTVAAEGFLSGGDYSLPGASLFTDDLFPQGYNKIDALNHSFRFGNPQPISTFLDFSTNEDSAHVASVSTAAARAGKWKRLDVNECRKIYGMKCTGLGEYRNLVLVTEGLGWRRSDLWNLSVEADALWEPIVPRNETNSLWYATQCEMTMVPKSGSAPECDNNCDGILADDPAYLDPELDRSWSIPLQWWYPNIPPSDKDLYGGLLSDDPSYDLLLHHDPFFDDAAYQDYVAYQPWSAPFSLPAGRSYFGRKFDSDALKISYCLAELGDCKSSVALSKPLFLAVLLSVFLKLIICIVTVRVLGSEEPLVTPGDAISSFISVQDSQAPESGLLTQELVPLRGLARGESASYAPLGPQKWSAKVFRQERGRAVTPDVWRRTYFILLFGVMAPLAVLIVQIISGIPL